MILNAVLAIALATVLALKVYTFVVILVAMITIVPAAWVEIALYRRQKGTWYRWRHPAPPRPRYVPTVDSSPYPRVEPFPWAGESVSGERPPTRSRTRLFESGDASETVSRASILLDVAHRLESSGSVGAAVRIYRQLVDDFADKPEALDAARRLQSIAERDLHAGRPEAQ